MRPFRSLQGCVPTKDPLRCVLRPDASKCAKVEDKTLLLDR